MKKDQIERISHMEQLFDFALEAMKRPMEIDMYKKTKEAITVLSEYYNSNDWKQDNADDEAGLLPENLKRGVLSEDGIWNLLSDWDERKTEL